MQRRPRVGHRKSRNGCVRCKKRRVKCDEERPCGNCIRHEVSCSLTEQPARRVTADGTDASRRHGSTPDSTAPSPVAAAATAASATVNLTSFHPSPLHSSSSSPWTNPIVDRGLEAATTIPTLSPGLAHVATPTDLPNVASPHVISADWMQSLRLLHHYSTVVYLTLSRNPATADLWKTAVPEAAFSHEFLMHGLLGISALHYAHTHPDQEHQYILISSHYQNLALQYFTTHLHDLNDQNCKPFFFLGTFIFLMTTCSIANPQESEKPVSSEDVARSFVLLQGVKSILSFKSIQSWKQDGPLAPLMNMMNPVGVRQTGAFQDRMEHLSALARRVSPSSLDAINTQTACLLAIESLRSTHCACTSDQSVGGAHRVWMWPMTLIQMFIELVRDKHPLALIILAHYAALVRPCEHPDWINQGWSMNVMASVDSSVGGEWREWLAWPKRSLQERIHVDDMGS